MASVSYLSKYLKHGELILIRSHRTGIEHHEIVGALVQYLAPSLSGKTIQVHPIACRLPYWPVSRRSDNYHAKYEQIVARNMDMDMWLEVKNVADMMQKNIDNKVRDFWTEIHQETLDRFSEMEAICKQTLRIPYRSKTFELNINPKEERKS